MFSGLCGFIKEAALGQFPAQLIIDVPSVDVNLALIFVRKGDLLPDIVMTALLPGPFEQEYSLGQSQCFVSAASKIPTCTIKTLLLSSIMSVKELFFPPL